ncbi:sensor histidine kinase [Macrococcoides canis]|uniref:sensor histidine kinase n=1 Tax=Macrococcoides canis TaxID=1855823 RepID=UPI0012FF8485|nr:HAMP domain-containing sensor histidine kinase [Macrococcus canis]UTG99783.1 HAMP domain-containing histidine kinase [Macrococcus canis]
MLFIFVIIGAKFFKNTIRRITELDNTLEEIIYKDVYPNKIDVSKNSQDEINLLAQTINKLIDRLRHKEMLLDTNLKTKNEHIQQLSHDINTPLTAITLELYELAQDYHIPDEKTEHIYSRINYTSQLVKKVSEATEVDLQNQYLFLTDINITQLLNKSLDKWQYLLDKKQITIMTNIEQNIIWNGDPLLYERLFDNILSNITHHSKTDEISIELNNSQLMIEDYGVGFTVNSNPPQKSGSGIIKSICERMNLKLMITSSKQGTKYMINQFSNS